MKNVGFVGVCLWLVMAGCGGGESEGVDAGTNGADASTNNADADTGEWRTLVAGDWTLPAGNEDYVCVRLTVTEDLYISEFEAINPEGTHHTVLTAGESAEPDGTFSCNAGTNDNAMIFGSGIGGDAIRMPPGVAMFVPAGQQLLLNLHLFNVGEGSLNGTSGTRIKTIPASQVEHKAEAILAGPVLSLVIPEGVSTQTGGCRMNGDVTIFAVGPHMHQWGTHMKVDAISTPAGAKTIHDDPYDFYEQKLYSIEPVQMARGDDVDVACTYNNTTGDTLRFGESSNDEMCFATLYRYPAFGATFGIICDNGF